MTTCRPLILLLAITTAAFIGHSPLEAAESKTFTDKNVKWTLPEGGGWQFMPMNEGLKKNGYVAQASNNNISTHMHVVVKDAEGLSAKAYSDEIVGFIRARMAKVQSSKAWKGTLSGLECRAVYVYGSLHDGTPLHGTSYVLLKEKRLYTVLVQVYHDAHKTQWKAIDAARRGVRLINGSGPEEQPAMFGVADDGPDTVKGTKPTRPPASAAGESGSDGADAAGGAEESGGWDSSTWPERGPKLEERTIVLPSHNMRWTVAEDAPWSVRVGENEGAHGQPLVAFAMSAGEGEAADTCEVMLLVQKRGAGFTTKALVNDIEYQNGLAKSLHARLPGGVTLEEDYEIAGINGSAFGLKGKTEKGAYITVTHYWVALRGEVYRIQTVAQGSRGCEQKFTAAVSDLLGGISFPEETEPVAGPIAGAVPFHVIPRGNYLTKEYTVKAPLIEVLKPEGFGKLTNLNDPNLHFAFETRSEDGTAYYYLDVGSYENAALSQQQIKLESWVEDRATAWETAATGNVKLRKGRKTKGALHSKAKWAKASGIGWRFEAEFYENPFVEYGYYVRHKKYTYVIREQFGGVDAEKKFKSARKALLKKWKWLKK